MRSASVGSGTEGREAVRVAAISDVHCKKDSQGTFRPVFARIAVEADILVLCGDLTHLGLPDEARVFLDAVEPALGKIPVVSTLGNHDFEAGEQEELRRILSGAGVILLDGNDCRLHGVGFVGVKGFGGGFDNRALHPWGESVVKDFVRESVDEAGKLESALARMDSGPRIALLHYAPIRGTVDGEHPELFPFLGSSRLEEPLDRHGVSAVFHGHAHHGYPEGKTKANIPVYNVCAAVLKNHFPKRPPFLVVKVAVQ